MSIQNKKVSDLMLDTKSFPIVGKKTIVKEAFDKMDNFRLGIACICNEQNQLLGIVTDGDIRRKLLNIQKPLSAYFIDDIINQAIKTPVTITSDTTLAEAILLMEKNQIWDLPVVNCNKLVGLLHLHAVTKSLLKQ